MKIEATKPSKVGLNVTEEDLIRESKAKDIMDKDVPFIYENMPLSEVLRIFGENSNLYYPVVNADKSLIGVITIDNIKDTFMTSGLDSFLLALDLMDPVVAVVTEETPMSEVKEILSKHSLDYLPVVTEGNKVAGFLEARRINNLISRKIMELQKQSGELD